MKRILYVSAILSAHYIVLTFANKFFGIRPTEYLLWIVLAELTFLNYDLPKFK